MKPKATIIIPAFRLLQERLDAFRYVVTKVSESGVPCVVIEQRKPGEPATPTEQLCRQLKGIDYQVMELDTDLINKSRLINVAASKIDTEYLWLLDSDVYLNYALAYEQIADQPVIKPFEYVIRLSQSDTAVLLQEGKITIKKGVSRIVTNIFGPLTFIIKKSVFAEVGGMNEKFKGWGWEDLEFAARVTDRHRVYELSNIRGLHLWHKRDISNERENRLIYDESVAHKEYHKTHSLPPQAEFTETHTRLTREGLDGSCAVPSVLLLGQNAVDTKPQAATPQAPKEPVNSIPNELAGYKFIEVPQGEIMEARTEGLIDLIDLSIVIPCRIDTEDRLRNLNIVFTYLKTNFKNYECIVVEDDATPKAKALTEKFGHRHIFRQTKNCFHKTYAFNLGIAASSRKYIAAYDTDVVFDPRAMKIALARLKTGKTKFIYPYNKVMVEIKRHLLTPDLVVDGSYIEQLPFSEMGELNNLEDYHALYGDANYPCTGGCVMFERIAFFENGGYNPNIVSYGCEDNEFDVRIKKLGNPIERLCNFNCYHLQHHRSVNSHYNNFFENNEAEFQKIKAMTPEQLREYTSNGYKHTVFDTSMALRITNTQTEFSMKLEPLGKIDLSDLCIIIPTFIDFDDRLRNLSTVLKYFEKYFQNYNIVLVEMRSMRAKYLYHKKNIEYYHLPETFYKTRAINYGLQYCTRKFVCIYDVDALITPQGMASAMQALRAGTHKIAYPYNGWFLDVNGDTKHKLFADPAFDKLPIYRDNGDNPSHRDLAVRFSTERKETGGGNNGGCVIFDQQKLLELGAYNENFFKWGFEDDEIQIRFAKYGFEKYMAPDANCYHMVHQRTDECSMNGKEYWKVNDAELQKTIMMDLPSLKEYVSRKFLDKQESLSVVFNLTGHEGPEPVELVHHYLPLPLVSDVTVIGSKTPEAYDKKVIVRPKALNNYSSDVVLYVKDERYTNTQLGRVLSRFSTIRRMAVVADDAKTIVAVKKEYIGIVDSELDTFTLLRASALLDGPKCSIILTNYGDCTRYSQYWMDRVAPWKNKNYEVIVVVHDETLLHRVYLEDCKRRGYIDQLIFAESKHGHINGINLGVQRANSEIVIVANNDIRLSKQVIDHCVERLADPQMGMVGWHYNWAPWHDGTFWHGDTLEYALRPDLAENLHEAEIAKIKSMPWYTGRLFNALGGEKRILCCNGSFFAVKKDVFLKAGGFQHGVLDDKEHFFVDDLLCYGILELGYNIANLPRDIRCSQKPEIFQSLSDLKFQNIPEPDRHKDEIVIDGQAITNKTFIEMLANRTKDGAIFVLGPKRPSLAGLANVRSTNKVSDLLDLLILNEPVNDFGAAIKMLKPGGVIVAMDEFARISPLLKPFSSIGVYLSEEPQRVRYSANGPAKSGPAIIVKKSPDLDKLKVAFLTEPRCGFTNLRVALNNTQKIWVEDSIFTSSYEEGTVEKRYERAAEFLRRFFYLQSTQKSANVIGFRFKSWDRPDGFFENYAINQPDLKKIIISRDNLLMSLVSCSLATQTNVWHSAKRLPEIKPFAIDLEWADGWLKSVRRITTAWKAAVKNKKDADCLVLEYNNLYKKESVDSISEYLKLPIKTLYYPFVRLEPANIGTLILNRKELEQRFSDFGFIEEV